MHQSHPREKVVGFEKLARARNRIFNGTKVVLTSGCYDLIHGGHVEYLFLAKSHGDFLIVGINSDDFVRRLKGKNRPVRKEVDRAFLIASMEMVDLVVIFDCDYSLIKAVRPHLYLTSNNSQISVYDDHERVKILSEVGAQIIELPYSDIDSTTSIIKRSIGKDQKEFIHQ